MPETQPNTLAGFKSMAKRLKREAGITHAQALNELAQHQRADMYQGWDDPAPPRRVDPDRAERIWWGIVGLFAGFALLMVARQLGAG